VIRGNPWWRFSLTKLLVVASERAFYANRGIWCSWLSKNKFLAPPE